MVIHLVSKIKTYLRPVILGFTVLLICLGNAIHPFGKAASNTDSSVFLIIGKSMHQGLMPYRDLFDHKGPLLYVINWLGMFAGVVGVWLIEFLSLLLAVWLCYKTARRFFDENASFFGTFVAFASLFPWFEGGNYTESYAIPLLFGGLYCLTGYFVQDFELKPTQLLISGACMGGILMLRPNMIGLFVGMCAVIFIHTLCIRKFRLIIRYILFFIAGILLSIAPFLIWLGAIGALDEFYYCFIEFNFMYVDTQKSAVFDSTISLLNRPIVLLVSILSIIIFFLKKSNWKKPGFIVTLAMLATLIMTVALSTMSGRSYAHYYMVLLPCLVLPVAWLSKMCLAAKLTPVMIFISFCLFLNRSLVVGAGWLVSTFEADTKAHVAAKTIQENLAPDKTMIYVGNYCYLYLLSDRMSSGYYPYLSGAMQYPEMLEAYIESMEDAKPALLVYGDRHLPDILQNYIDGHYTVIDDSDSYRIICKRIPEAE